MLKGTSSGGGFLLTASESVWEGRKEGQGHPDTNVDTAESQGSNLLGATLTVKARKGLYAWLLTLP